MKPKKTALLLAGSLTALLASHSAHAALQTWDNVAANSTWDDSSLNWAGAAWTDGNDAVFDTTGAGAVTVSGTRSVGDLTVSSAGYSFSGGILSVAKLSAANNWTISNDTAIASGVTANFSGGAITGTLTKLGAGTLTLSGAVNATGFGTTGSGNWGITVSAGSLELSGTSTFSSAGLIVGGTGNATISAGTHNFTGATQRIGLAMTAGRTVTVSGGTVNTGKILVGNGSSGIFTQSGGTIIIPTTVGVDLGTSGTASDTSVFNLDGGILQALKLAPVAGWKGTTTINLNGGTFRAVGAANTNLFSVTGALSQPGNVYVKAGGAVIDPNGRNVTISSSLLTHPTSTGGGLTKLGGTTLTLSGANTYTGTTTINLGTLTIGSASTSTGSTILGGATGVGDVVLANTVKLGQSASLWYANKVTLKGDITLEGNNRQQVGFKILDLDGGTRTVFVNPTGGNVKQTIPGDTALEGTGRSRWEMLDISDLHPVVPNVGTLTVQNGTLDLATNLTGADYAGFMFQFPSVFAANAGVIVGANILLKTGAEGALGTTTDSTLTAKLTVNGIWTLGSSTGTGHTVHSLAGSGKIYTSMVATNATAQTITLNGTDGSTDFSGVLSNGPGTGPLSITKTGASTQILSGANTYTGDTTVTGGVLGVTGSSMADANKLVVDGGQVDLTGAETVGTLFFGAVQKAAGTYSASGAGGTIASSNFTGAGTLVVTSGPPAGGYSTWASANAGSQDANLDFDNDGVSNGVEYFMGQTGSTFTANPTVVTVGAVSTVTWPRDPAAVATFKVQISDTLAAGGWTDIVPPDASIDESNPNQITFTLPSGAPKKFCRLSVTTTP
jgi:fibronectin-binding autotransporter adhesin